VTQTAPIPAAAPHTATPPELRAAPRTVRLNAFQVLMRRWTALAPYNAGQMMHVTGEPDIDRWRAAAESIIGELGLGIPRFSGRDAVTFQTVPFVAVERTTADPTALFNEELNRAFAAGEMPIRFFVLRSEPGTHHFAAVYDHWIADSRAMRELMQRIFARYQAAEAPALPALQLECPPFNRLFRKYVGWLPRSAAMRQSFYNVVRHRRACRINLPNALDFTARVIHRQLPDGLIQRLHRHAKAHGGSVNDVFLAVLGQTMGEHTSPTRYRRRTRFYRLRRERVGLGTIVDIRDAAAEPLDNVFGLYLSSYTVTLARPEKRPLDELVEELAILTRRIKRKRTAVRSFQAFAMARWWWDFFREKRYQALFFQKTVPVAAGISNVNMTGCWADPQAHAAAEPEHPMVLDYVRISPTGPLLPLVFTLTTIGQRLSLCVTYRTTAFATEEAEALVADFAGRLNGIGP